MCGTGTADRPTLQVFQWFNNVAAGLLSGGGMAIAKITGNGLISISVLVACLWGCLLTEHKILVESQRRQSKELIELRRLRNSRFTVPAFLPTVHSTTSRPFAS